MARSKHRRKPTAEGAAGQSVSLSSVVHEESGGLGDYVTLNLFFWGLCLLQLLVVRLLLPSFAGLYFFFFFLMISFTIVSVFDYFANKVGLGDQIEDNSELLNDQN